MPALLSQKIRIFSIFCGFFYLFWWLCESFFVSFFVCFAVVWCCFGGFLCFLFVGFFFQLDFPVVPFRASLGLETMIQDVTP